MATYADYSAKISGKDFSSNYLVTAKTFNDHAFATGDGYEGSGSDFIQGTGFSGQITILNANAGTFTLAGYTCQIHGSSADGNLLFFQFQAGGRLYAINNPGGVPSGTVTYNTLNPYNTPAPTCFAAGTLITTSTGDRPVETLAPGDLVWTEGEIWRPVRWIGHRRVVCAGNPWARHLAPIRIEADAIAPGCPTRDLLVSPGHCLALGDTWLVEAEHLLNGVTIRREEVATVQYWHVELDAHAVMLAEGVPVESYIDVGNREAFDNGAGEPLDAAAIAAALARYCRPVVSDRAALAALRAPLDERAALLQRVPELVG